MNHKILSAVQASQASAEVARKNTPSTFMAAGNADFTDGIFSLWPKEPMVFSEEKVSAPTVANGDDAVMSTAALSA